MSKSILVIDTPSSCRECYNSDNNIGVHCIYKFHGKARTQRHPQCPLQDTTELLEALESINNMGVSDGEGGYYNPIQFHKKKQYNKLYKALGGE